MPYDLSSLLVVGVSSRALFDLEYENQIYDTQGWQPFLEYQRNHEDDLPKPGTGFHLVKSLLALNVPSEPRRVEVIVMSRNHPEVYLRVSNAIRHHRLDVSRSMLTGGEPLARYLRAYKFDLFLSAWEDDVTSALGHGIAAGRIYKPPTADPVLSDQIRIAFDGDCVLFGAEAESINTRDGLAAFHTHERENATVPLPDGPFAKLIRTISQMQGPDPNKSPFRIGLVTARNAPAHERAIRTLRNWKVRVDGAAFLGGMTKDPWLVAFRPHIFFDDQASICTSASPVVPTAQVLFPLGPEPSQQPPTKMVAEPERKNRFLLICRGYLKKSAKTHLPVLEQWYAGNLANLESDRAEAVLAELEESAQNTPLGKERPAASGVNLSAEKLVAFLAALLRKHTK